MPLRNSVLMPALLALVTMCQADSGKEKRSKDRSRAGAGQAESKTTSGEPLPLPRATQGHRPQDLNGDGVITRKEWPGDDASFRREDSNHDGVITDADRQLVPKGKEKLPVHSTGGKKPAAASH